ncbi:MAG TPA: hypothetical protein VF395_13405 [Polyangiaceae bacterium]
MNQMAQPERQQVLSRVQSGVEDAKHEVAKVDRQLQRFVRTRPLAATLTALVVGFTVGRIVSRI